MTKFLPIFPLDIIVYPGQQLNLHVFEPRYKQLVAECVAGKKTFGIPTINRDVLNEYGTEVEILEVTKTYEGGEMDIKTQGVKIFKVLEVLKEVPDKLYPAAVVFEVKHLPFDTQMLNPTLFDLMKKLQKLMGTDFDIFKNYATRSLLSWLTTPPLLPKTSIVFFLPHRRKQGSGLLYSIC